jgi:hypothetical protein
MPFGATPSRWCVCQFHHFRTPDRMRRASRAPSRNVEAIKYSKDKGCGEAWGFAWLKSRPALANARAHFQPFFPPSMHRTEDFSPSGAPAFQPSRLSGQSMKAAILSEDATNRSRPSRTPLSFRRRVEVVIGAVAALYLEALLRRVAIGCWWRQPALGVNALDTGDTAEHAIPGMTGDGHQQPGN